MVGHRACSDGEAKSRISCPCRIVPPAAQGLYRQHVKSAGRLCAYIKDGASRRAYPSLHSAMGPAAPLLLLLATAAARIFRIPLDTNSTFSWTLDYPAGTISVEVHTTAGQDHWVAVGFSDYGALEDADLCVLWRDWRGHTHLQVCWNGHTSTGML